MLYRYVYRIDTYTAHTLTVPVVSRFGHFVICIYILTFGSNFFITSKLRLNLLVATSKLSLNLLLSQHQRGRHRAQRSHLLLTVRSVYIQNKTRGALG